MDLRDTDFLTSRPLVKGACFGKGERIVDRTKDMLIMGGFKVFSKRVEIDKKLLIKEAI